ncbi:sodium:proton antiporter [Oribacterium sp. C9]|uniref:Na+/H+ antiporter NhaC family protein n=1 Tax=Oribacterium sp. C9 TaxID=1943579 RepID=UPI00099014A5|nr:Na+/H+ antiporter NhaC family protein [Oribacterium sp. C9]OON86845.1 sodium:proton antiporter [Oribacterium sp. C9]
MYSNDDTNQKKGSFLGLVPLLVFLVLYFTMGIGSGSFDNFPLLIGMFIAMVISLMLKKPGDNKTFSEKVDMFCEGGGDKTLILMVVIYMLAGAFYGVAKAMHATDSVTNIMLSAMPTRMILPGLFLIGCVLSFSMGTSMGTVSALLPIGLDIASKTGVNVALICGIVVGGAMFGDNLSFISDTTIAATTTQGVDMRAKFKANVFMVLPAVIINIIVLALIPIRAESIITDGAFDIVNLIPYVMIIALSLAGIHVIPAMGLSIIVGTAIGIIHGDFTFAGSFNIIHEGMTWMEDMSVIAVFVGGVIALMKYYGGIDWLLSTIGRNTKGRVGGELSIALLVTLVDIATTNNTMAIIACGPIAKDISKKYDIAPERTASILDLFSSAGNGITPYAGQLLVAGGLAGIAPISIMPFVFYSWLMFGFGLLFIILGLPSKLTHKKEHAEKGQVKIA